MGRSTQRRSRMSISKTRELPTKKVIDWNRGAFFEVQNFSCDTIGVDHTAAALHENVARQSFEE